jgi:ABC-2 type transport system permease protein
MLGDILIVMTKEWREMFLSKARVGWQRGGLATLLILIGLFGLFIPLRTGPSWVNSPIVFILWSWMPFMLITSVVADSFAGERERHTLETLLATRLHDRAILFGKLGAAIGYGWGFSLATLVISLIALNIAFAKGQLLMYPGGIIVGTVTMSLLISTLAAGIGVLVSLHASSVQQAQQQLSLGMFAVIIVPVVGYSLLPAETKTSIANALAGGQTAGIFIVVVLGLLIVDVIFIALAMARFQRSKLILD